MTAVAEPWASVVIVAYNSGALLQDCVDALSRQTMPDFEAIIVDNASSDGSTHALHLPDARFRLVSAGANLGFAGGTNLGIESARAPWIATLNPDAAPAPDWLAALRRATGRHPDITMFGSTQIDASNLDRLDGCGDAYSFLGLSWRACHGHPAIDVPPEGETFAPCAAAALYRSDVLDAVGKFDERFFCYCEDVDLAFRIRLRSGKCIQVPDAVVRHVGSAITGPESYFTLYHSARNRVWLMLKNMPPALLTVLLPAHLGYMALTLWFHRGKEGHYIAATLAGLRAAFSDMRPVLQARRAIQEQRRISTLAVARMLCWNPYKLWRCEPDLRPLGGRMTVIDVLPMPDGEAKSR